MRRAKFSDGTPIKSDATRIAALFSRPQPNPSALELAVVADDGQVGETQTRVVLG
jgi:hypothetical protein